jgi:hypothetical protein
LLQDYTPAFARTQQKIFARRLFCNDVDGLENGGTLRPAPIPTVKTSVASVMGKTLQDEHVHCRLVRETTEQRGTRKPGAEFFQFRIFRCSESG